MGVAILKDQAGSKMKKRLEDQLSQKNLSNLEKKFEFLHSKLLLES